MVVTREEWRADAMEERKRAAAAERKLKYATRKLKEISVASLATSARLREIADEALAYVKEA